MNNIKKTLPMVAYAFQADKGTASMLGAVEGRTWKEAWRAAAKKAAQFGYVLWCIYPMKAPAREIRRPWERVSLKIKARQIAAERKAALDAMGS